MDDFTGLREESDTQDATAVPELFNMTLRLTMESLQADILGSMMQESVEVVRAGLQPFDKFNKEAEERHKMALEANYYAGKMKTLSFSPKLY